MLFEKKSRTSVQSKKFSLFLFTGTDSLLFGITRKGIAVAAILMRVQRDSHDILDVLLPSLNLLFQLLMYRKFSKKSQGLFTLSLSLEDFDKTLKIGASSLSNYNSVSSIFRTVLTLLNIIRILQLLNYYPLGLDLEFRFILFFFFLQSISNSLFFVFEFISLATILLKVNSTDSSSILLPESKSPDKKFLTSSLQHYGLINNSTEVLSMKYRTLSGGTGYINRN